MSVATFASLPSESARRRFRVHRQKDAHAHPRSPRNLTRLRDYSERPPSPLHFSARVRQIVRKPLIRTSAKHIPRFTAPSVLALIRTSRGFVPSWTNFAKHNLHISRAKALQTLHASVHSWKEIPPSWGNSEFSLGTHPSRSTEHEISHEEPQHTAPACRVQPHLLTQTTSRDIPASRRQVLNESPTGFSVLGK